MLRALPILLLLWACSAAAQNGRTPVPDNATNCQELADKSAAGLQHGDSPRAATAVRNKYAPPATRPNSPAPAPVRGGGDDDDAPMTRPRAPKWHSFLPGMFR